MKTVKQIAVLFILLFSLQSCLLESERGEVIFTQAEPSKGFNYPYFLFIPEEASREKELVLIVEPNNSGFANDNFDKHIEKAKRTARLDFYIGNYVAQNLKYPLLVPVFPRSESEWKIYTHALDRDVMLQKNKQLERIDLQLLAMMEHAKSKLIDKGYQLNDKSFMTGFSASGTFVNRFTAIHPEKVLATAAGGVNGLLILPLDKMKEQALDFPLGTNDFETLFGKPFDAASFTKTPQFYFMGALDENDAIPYEDAFSPEERAVIYELLGKEMLSQRWQKCDSIYNSHGTNFSIKTLDDIGHEQPESIKKEIVMFFENAYISR